MAKFTTVMKRMTTIPRPHQLLIKLPVSESARENLQLYDEEEEVAQTRRTQMIKTRQMQYRHRESRIDHIALNNVCLDWRLEEPR